jgi:cell division protease FtsH
MDERITQIGKSRARRFVRAKEANSTKDTNNSASQSARVSTTTPTQTTKAVTPHVNLEPPVTFDDVAGIEEVRTELEEIVRFLRNPGQFNRLGAHIPRGALLVGPPGTGKTLLAKAVAGEAGVPFFSMSASEFVEMFVGVGASRVRDLFNQARQVAPCVIFIDEIDAVGRKRTMRVSGNDERDQTLNQLLVELDGFNERQTVVVLAATNRVDILDKALLRPGRFDRCITVSLPDRVGRQAILKVHTRKTPLHEEVSLERLARLTTGMSGADLANLVNEAALCAARRDLDRIPHDCFEDALARVQLGALRPLVMSERERRIIAFHEGGHALVAHHLPEADTVNRVTILPRGQSLGVTQFTAEEDRYNYSRHMLMARIAVGLGGRVAEELTFGLDQITTGAENDLQVVTNLARRMVTRWGMSERIGVVFTDFQAGDGEMSLNMQRVDPDPAHALSLALNADSQLVRNGMPELRQAFALSTSASRTMSGATMNALIDSEVQSILNEGREMARTLLCEHGDQLTQLANALMEYEQLDRAQFEALLA